MRNIFFVKHINKNLLTIIIKIFKQYKYLFAAAFIIIFSFYVSSNWFQLVFIHGESMSPSYHNMQFVIMDRHSTNYTYGDVIAFRCDELDTVLIKRIVACPNDSVWIKDKQLYVNNILSEVFSSDNTFEYAGIAEEMIYLTEGQYFVIGDNMVESKDSRYIEVGLINKDKILGIII